MADLTRRELIQGAVAAGVAMSIAGLDQATAATPQPAATGPANADASIWLDTTPATAAVGTTWGLPWARGTLKKDDTLRVETDAGTAVPAQTWTTAYWPDGSVKWSAIAVGPEAAAGAKSFKVTPGAPATGNASIKVTDAAAGIEIDTGTLQCAVAKTGSVLIQSIKRGGKTVLTGGRLVAISQDTNGEETPGTRETFGTKLTSATVEQSGPVRAVVKLVGTHATGTRAWLPFVVRLYFYAGSDVIRVMHSFVWDGDEYKDFLAGLGVRFDVAMTEEPHNRHVRFVGQDGGVFAEAVRGITGMRRDPGEKSRTAQIEGKATPWQDWAGTVANRRQYIPTWGDYTLSQLTADGFQIRKRTKGGCAWIPSAAGRRSAGVGYVGGAAGGVSFGLRDFWQKHPAQLDVRHAATDVAQVTVWLYSPDAKPMDMRFYHDGLGMDTYDKQIEGLNITYEDYEPGYGTPYGIGRTSELSLRVEAATPSNASLAAYAEVVRMPPTLMASPARLLSSGVFGAIWTLPDRSTPAKAWIEDNLKATLDQYIKEIDQRSWYGFWDYGDVMHSYDTDRHQWRYDVGGYAWDNSELSPDLWLWLSAMRTGRADVFRMAEAMCRHTGEVDVYHLGRFKGLGTRHGVQHWADSSKQSRISTPSYRRNFYFLTADERSGDLLEEQMTTVVTEKKIVVGRKLRPGSPTLPLPPVEDPPPGGELGFGGLNWGCAMAAWVTKAERTNDPAWHAKIVESLRGVGELSKGFYTSGTTINLDTGKITEGNNPAINLSHLMACFGLPEVAVELITLYGDQAPKFAAAWAQYGRLYSGTDEQRRKELGDFPAGAFKGNSLRDSHSRCTAYAAKFDKDDALAKRAWAELLGNRFSPDAPQAKATRVLPPEVLNPIDEVPMGTNGAAQWGLAAIQCLALVGDKLS